jgi:hypothetical protein
MKNLRAVFCFLICAVITTSCSSINYNEAAPNASSFKQKVGVVLPTIKMPEGADQEADRVVKALYDAAVATKRFERVIDPATAKSQMAENSQLQDAVMTYISKLRTLGVSDKEAAKKIGEIYQADTIVAVEVGKWGYVKYADEKAGEVGIAIKMADAATGSVYWKAAHAGKKTYKLFKPDLADLAADISSSIFAVMPKP